MIKGYSTASSDMIRGYNRILLHGIGGSGQLNIDEKMVGGGEWKVNGKSILIGRSLGENYQP